MQEAIKYVKENCPWPEGVFPMSDKEYVRAIPEPRKRSAVSGFLMREGWRLCIQEIERRIAEGEVNDG